MHAKLNTKLAEQLERVDASDFVDVVLELNPPADQAIAASGPQSRSQKIAAQKEMFSRNAAPVEEAVRQLGGEVTGQAWINRTMRARVPAQGVRELSELENVAAVDLPHPIEPEAG